MFSENGCCRLARDRDLIAVNSSEDDDTIARNWFTLWQRALARKRAGSTFIQRRDSIQLACQTGPARANGSKMYRAGLVVLSNLFVYRSGSVWLSEPPRSLGRSTSDGIDLFGIGLENLPLRSRAASYDEQRGAGKITKFG